MTMNKETALVVFSGGQDSTTCLFWAKKHFKKVVALSFVYGQKHVKEVELAKAIASRADVDWDCMDVSFVGSLGRRWMRRSPRGIVRIRSFPGVTCSSSALLPCMPVNGASTIL